MPRYLLSCSCGKTIPIDTIQAGQEVSCECGQSLEVPTLREIRQLPELKQVVSQQQRMKKPWSGSRTSTFAAGLVVAAMALAAVIMCRGRIADKVKQLPSKEAMKSYEEAMSSEIIGNLTPEQAYQQFVDWKELGLGEQMERQFEVEHEQLDRLRLINWVFVILGGVGLAITAAAMLWPRGYVEVT